MPAKKVSQVDVDMILDEQAPVAQPETIVREPVQAPVPEAVQEPIAEQTTIEQAPEVTPVESMGVTELGELQTEVVALGQGSEVVEGSEQAAEAQTAVPVNQPTTPAVISAPLYARRSKSSAALKLYTVTIKDAYAEDHPAYTNVDARAQYYVLASSAGDARQQVKNTYPQYNQFEVAVN
jgi:hypothetical protein